MGTIPATALRPCMVRLVKLLACWKPHFCYAQQLLAERMITIVAHFCTQVVRFIFGGRNSGQGEKRSDRSALEGLWDQLLAQELATELMTVSAVWLRSSDAAVTNALPRSTIACWWMRLTWWPSCTESAKGLPAKAMR
jgi:hypothetical protein